MYDSTYDPVTDMVTTPSPIPGMDPNRVSFKAFYAQQFVVAHLHWCGKLRDILTLDEQWAAYCACDGFGDMDPDDLGRYGWDWSHVRDSTPEGFERAANLIAKRWVRGSLDALVQQARDDYENLRAKGVDVTLLDMVVKFK